MDVQALCNQAVADLAEYSKDAQVVVDDQAKLATDQETASAAAATAQASTKAAISALTDALAALPAVPAVQEAAAGQ